MTSHRLLGRGALVTGAARGLGQAIAQRLLEEGCHIVLADFDGDELSKTACQFREQFGPTRCIDVVGDISRTEDATRAVEAATTAWGRLDIVVNNAGIGDAVAFEDLTLERFNRVMRVNVESALACTQAALPWLKVSPCARVVNLGSILGVRVAPDNLAYGTSKGAIVALTKCLAVDLSGYGIRVNAVAPGSFDTRMALLNDGTREYDTEWYRRIYLEWGRLPLGRIGELHELAAAVFYFCSDDSSYVTGQTLLVDGGLSARF
jgi:NAD(P)-dependent dehydrogenase (short-subunit alcohol dehydrogenase family)